MRVSRNAWSNAGGVVRWAAPSAAGERCSNAPAEEAGRELRIAMAGFHVLCRNRFPSTATEKSFTDGDRHARGPRPFLAARATHRAAAVKMRCTSGAGSELLMGFHEAKNRLLYPGGTLVSACRRGNGGAGYAKMAASTGRLLTATIPGGVPRN